jgi:hypothetical protein
MPNGTQDYTQTGQTAPVPIPQPAQQPQPAPQPSPSQIQEQQLQELMRRMISRLGHTQIVPSPSQIDPRTGQVRQPKFLAPAEGFPVNREQAQQMFVHNLFSTIFNAAQAQKKEQLNHAVGVLQSLNNSWQKAQDLAQGDPQKAEQLFSSMPEVTHILEDKKNVKQLGKLLNFDFLNPEKKKTVWHEALGRVVEAGKALGLTQAIGAMMKKHKEQQSSADRPPTDPESIAGREQQASGIARQLARMATAGPVDLKTVAEAEKSLSKTPPGYKHVSSYTNEQGQHVDVFADAQGNIQERAGGAVQEKREPAGTDSDKWVKDYLASHKLDDTPENRMKAREDYVEKNRVAPALIRAEGFGETRGPVVTDTKTGITAPMSWSDYNRKSKAEPGRYVSAQYDPDTVMKVSAWRDLAKGQTKNQAVSYDTFIRHAGDLYDAVDTLRNTRSPLINKPLNWLRANAAGRPEIRVFLAKLDPVLKEFESFLLNNRALYEEDRRDAKRILDENSTPAQMVSVLQSMAHTGDARLQALNEGFKRATGEDIPGLYSEPATKILNKLGVKAGGSTAQPGQPPAGASQPPPGAKGRVKGSDGKWHWTDGKRDLGVAE